MAAWRQNGENTRISLRVIPKSAQNLVAGVKNDQVVVAAFAAPGNGAASAAAIEVLSARLGCSKSQISLIGGQKCREKLVCVEAMSAAQIAGKLGALV